LMHPFLWTEVPHHWVIGARIFENIVISFSRVEMSRQKSFIEDVKYALYRVADKSLARPGRKQATATEDFDVHISYLLP
jgi:hypothetical protein